MTDLVILHALQAYVLGLPIIDLLATIREPGMAERPESCEAFEASLLRLIQQPGLAEPIQETIAPPRPAGPPHAGTCSLPKVLSFTHFASTAESCLNLRFIAIPKRPCR